jgi:hypothetical protein
LERAVPLFTGSGGVLVSPDDGAGINGTIRFHITSVITNRTDTSDQLTSSSKRHALGTVPLTCPIDRETTGKQRSITGT